MTIDERPVPSTPSEAARTQRAADERRIGRLLIAITDIAVAILVVGVGLMLVAGISPLAAPPIVDPATLPAALVSLQPAAILLLGIAVVIATPIVRVIAAAVSYARSGEVRMLGISIAILVVIAIGVLSATLTGASPR